MITAQQMEPLKDPPKIIEPERDYTKYEVSPAFRPTEGDILEDIALPHSAAISASLPVHYSPAPVRKDSFGSLSSGRGNLQFQSDFDVSKTYDTPKSKWRYKSDACSLSSRNSDADDEDEEIYSTSHLSNTSLPLTPFKNQVGGHASFLRFSDKALCKPMDVREQSFYEKISSNYPQLLPFVATYLGTVNVTFKPSTAGNVMAETPVVMLEHNQHILGALEDNQDVVVTNNGKYFNRKLQQQVFREALSPNGLRARLAQLRTAPDVSKINWTKSEVVEKKCIFDEKDEQDQYESDSIFKMSDDEFTPSSKSPKKSFLSEPLVENPFEVSELASALPRTPEKDHFKLKHFNPWSAHLYNTRMAKIQEGEQTIQKFLLLEDLTEGLVFPCILDLKMGTRQHGVNATPEKKASQERKCERSTSKRLGVRICGMQLYKEISKSFIYLDKYVGRQINVANFKQSLLSFLDNGVYYLTGHIPGLLKRLRSLYDAASSMESSRFYASSLLIYYDGDMNQTKEAQIKMIDFANCVLQFDKNCNFPPTTNGPDGGYLLGLQTLMTHFEEIYKELADPSLVNEYGHVLIQSLPISKRAFAEIGHI